MINLDMTFEDMKKEIGFTHYLVDEVISPKENPEYFDRSTNLIKTRPTLNEKYRTELFKGLEYWQIPDVFFELQHNSFRHGNNWNLELPVHIRFAKGEHGHAVQIEDCGDEGFDIYEKLRLKESGEKYYENEKGGCGLNHAVLSNAIVSYEGKGNIVNLMYKAGL